MNLGHQLFTGNASSLAKKELGKEFTGYIYYREASNQVVEGFPFYFFPFFFFHSCLFLCVFLLFCWDSEHGGKQIKFKIQIFPYYFVVEELCIVTDLVWVETEILFIIIYLRALFIN